MGRTPCCNHEEMKKGAWTAEEDQKLISYIQTHGTGSWRTLPQKAGQVSLQTLSFIVLFIIFEFK